MQPFIDTVATAFATSWISLTRLIPHGRYHIFKTSYKLILVETVETFLESFLLHTVANSNSCMLFFYISVVICIESKHMDKNN